ncbi:hypothetical protein GDO81_024131 [Engystomops pustulosus]|uniref:Uncharacterized protein n=1 Tax=Engystomops pustulosus TaxID=76066 RepID=A0AAV6ZKU5_ENGPU|nr:hypothetical protein GDO81_024131 [Engystomops pustulosus]
MIQDFLDCCLCEMPHSAERCEPDLDHRSIRLDSNATMVPPEVGLKLTVIWMTKVLFPLHITWLAWFGFKQFALDWIPQGTFSTVDVNN